MKNSYSTIMAAFAAALATLTLTVATSAGPEEELALEADMQPVTAESALPGVAGSETRTIDGTGLRAVTAPGTETIDGTGLRPSASDGTETIDGTGRLNAAPDTELGASGQPLRTIESTNGNDDCEVPAGVNAAASGDCETADPEVD